jgi:hypothetical protein
MSRTLDILAMDPAAQCRSRQDEFTAALLSNRPVMPSQNEWTFGDVLFLKALLDVLVADLGQADIGLTIRELMSAANRNNSTGLDSGWGFFAFGFGSRHGLEFAPRRRSFSISAAARSKLSLAQSENLFPVESAAVWSVLRTPDDTRIVITSFRAMPGGVAACPLYSIECPYQSID